MNSSLMRRNSTSHEDVYKTAPRRPSLAELQFAMDTIGAQMPQVVDDLPAGARRLVQRARGVAATVVNGEVLLRDGKHTGAFPGQLLRGPLAARA
jgi:N-acyl-D-aspartate/D-glutamate deacylase